MTRTWQQEKGGRDAERRWPVEFSSVAKRLGDGRVRVALGQQDIIATCG